MDSNLIFLTNIYKDKKDDYVLFFRKFNINYKIFPTAYEYDSVSGELKPTDDFPEHSAVFWEPPIKEMTSKMLMDLRTIDIKYGLQKFIDAAKLLLF